MDDTSPGVDRHLTWLRWLVTALTGTMVLGLLVLIYLFVTRFPDPDAIPLPEQIALPDGARATAFTRGRDWFAVVTQEDEILILNAGDGSLRQRIAITPAD
ncbi:hypothetical protein EKE94_02585 [Mesobaculum littorinae]|uniref:Uncharacterized protein n=1 Tax=Mesobaculum littorinae TaxID=2486419 RepID=A0A438ALX0_9RHOB|nr:DUF6476 family protein [Mesobaculum littorinae]RVV99587.1 hypothetical protein EKE94_02585 [Mesobaculum littorinae]